jgi:glycosyltransferase involved in cell wall biosynthesis
VRLPPTPSGVADYTADLLPHVAERADLAVAVADDAPQPPTRQRVLRVSELDRRSRDEFDLPIYHVGNHRLHAEVVRLALDWPGLVVLHDAVLHHLYADVALARGRGASYLREVGFEGGRAAIPRAIEAVVGSMPPAWYEQPLIARVVRAARGVIVHSEWARAAVRRADERVPVRVVHHGVSAPHVAPLEAGGGFVVGSFGGLTLEKRIPSVVAGFAALRRVRPDARLVLGGDLAPNLPVRELLERHGVVDPAEVTGRLELGEMERRIRGCHVVVQLRWPTAGEASGVTLRAMRAGRPVVVADCGWFGELPDEAAARIPAGGAVEDEARMLGDLLVRLADDSAERARLGAGARTYAATCGWGTAAGAYVDFAARLVA